MPSPQMPQMPTQMPSQMPPTQAPQQMPGPTMPQMPPTPPVTSKSPSVPPSPEYTQGPEEQNRPFQVPLLTPVGQPLPSQIPQIPPPSQNPGFQPVAQGPMASAPGPQMPGMGAVLEYHGFPPNSVDFKNTPWHAEREWSGPDR